MSSARSVRARRSAGNPATSSPLLSRFRRRYPLVGPEFLPGQWLDQRNVIHTDSITRNYPLIWWALGLVTSHGRVSDPLSTSSGRCNEPSQLGRNRRSPLLHGMRWYRKLARSNRRLHPGTAIRAIDRHPARALRQSELPNKIADVVSTVKDSADPASELSTKIHPRRRRGCRCGF
jgi:hypothetical protein